VAVSCGHCNESSGSIKGRIYLEKRELFIWTVTTTWSWAAPVPPPSNSTLRLTLSSVLPLLAWRLQGYRFVARCKCFVLSRDRLSPENDIPLALVVLGIPWRVSLNVHSSVGNPLSFLSDGSYLRWYRMPVTAQVCIGYPLSLKPGGNCVPPAFSKSAFCPFRVSACFLWFSALNSD
jgi:hypothetical protein